MKFFLNFLLVFLLSSYGFSDTKISNLTLANPSTVITADSFPYVNSALSTTQRLQISDIFNIPAFNSHTFSGTVTAGSFVGPLTGNVTGNVTGNASGTAANVTGVVAVVNGGTGQSSFGSGILQSNGTTISSSTVALTSQVAGTLPAGNGGTGQTSIAAAFVSFYESVATTLGDLVYGGASGTPTRLAGNTTAAINFLGQTGNGSNSAAPAWTAFTPPTVQTLTLGGETVTGNVFYVSANATVGATYTNNGHTFTVLNTIAAGSLLFTSGTGTLSGSSGTLTKSGGTGDSTISYTNYNSLATYTTPTSPRTPVYLKIRMVGGGGGGGGGGGSGVTIGGSGTLSAFGVSLLIANGAAAQLGGTGSLGAGPIGFTITGGQGAASQATSGSTIYIAGGEGASGPFGGSGGGVEAGPGTAGAANSGSGGGGGGVTLAAAAGGVGGGAGGYVDAIITSPSATYYYAVGGGGAAGSAGTSGSAGGAGANGIVIVEEHYQ